MAMDASEIERLIKGRAAGRRGHHRGPRAGDGDHYAAKVRSTSLLGQVAGRSSTRWVYTALKGEMGGAPARAGTSETSAPLLRAPTIDRQRAMTNPVFNRIQETIDAGDVHLFMKGTPMAPQCGFSGAVVQVLGQIGVPFTSTDVLADGEIREGIKAFSNWPTIPQLYIKGEFVGGCDNRAREMAQSGELTALLEEKGVQFVSA